MADLTQPRTVDLRLPQVTDVRLYVTQQLSIGTFTATLHLRHAERSVFHVTVQDSWLLTLDCWKCKVPRRFLETNSIFTPFPGTFWVRKEIKFGYSCSLCKILHSWYRQSSCLHSAAPRARDGLSVSLVQDFAEKAFVPKLDSYIHYCILSTLLLIEIEDEQSKRLLTQVSGQIDIPSYNGEY